METTSLSLVIHRICMLITADNVEFGHSGNLCIVICQKMFWLWQSKNAIMFWRYRVLATLSVVWLSGNVKVFEGNRVKRWTYFNIECTFYLYVGMDILDFRDVPLFIKLALQADLGAIGYSDFYGVKFSMSQFCIASWMPELLRFLLYYWWITCSMLDNTVLV